MTKSFEERFDERFVLREMPWEDDEHVMEFNGEPIGGTIRSGKEIDRWFPEFKKKVKDFIRQEISLAKKEERERILKILDESIFNDPDYYHGSEKLSCLKDLIQKITNE
jgi:hypothetical protein